MSHNFNQYGKQIGVVSNSLAEYAILIGTSTTGETSENILDYRTGLNMDMEASILQTHADSIRRGIFKIMVMGTFKNGKSTFLNSLIGVKILPSRVLACTAIITIVVYGKNKDEVLVYYRNRPEPEKMSIADFNAKFKLSTEDIDKVDKEGYLDKFANVDYAVIESDYPLCNNGVQIGDSPGLEERKSASDVTNNFAPTCNAIIFTLNATALGSEKEREIIREKYANRQFTNVFFVVNKIDCIDQTEVNEVKDATRKILHDVFVDKNGKFDEKLYAQRVFFTNAQKALNAKINDDAQAFAESGVADFENALKIFLMNDSKYKATFSSALTAMTNIYPNVLDKMEQITETMQRPLGELIAARDEAYTILKEQEKKKENLKTKFKTTADTVFLKLSHSLKTYVDTMKRTWDTDVENIEIKGFGVWKAVKGIFVSDKKKKELYKPVAEAIEKYIRDKMEIWKKQAEITIREDVDLLAKEVKEFTEEFEVQVTKAVDIFTGRISREADAIKNRFNVFQTLAGVLVGEPNMAVLGAMGLYSWDKFIVRMVYNVLITMGVLLVFGNIAGLIFIIIESFQIWNASKQLQMQILQKIKNDLFAKLEESVKTGDEKLEKEIKAEFDKQFQPIDKAVSTIISQTKNFLDGVIHDIETGQNALDEELNRHQAIRERLFVLTGQVFGIVHGHEMTSDDFKEYTKTNETWET